MSDSRQAAPSKILGLPDYFPNKCVPNKIKQEQKQTEAGNKKEKGKKKWSL